VPPPADVVDKVGKRVGDIEQPDLKAALTRLGQAALTKAAKTAPLKSSPQAPKYRLA
jgi:hypothetical protein